MLVLAKNGNFFAVTKYLFNVSVKLLVFPLNMSEIGTKEGGKGKSIEVRCFHEITLSFLFTFLA